ncbi:hypothetical protein LTR28_010952, partial [Elasticomyces elasticus]
MATLASPMLQTRSANIDPYRPPSALRFRDLPTTAHPLDERTLLSPSIGLDISRPSSASSQSSAQHPLSRSFSASALQLPALSALASLAASVPAATTSINRCVSRLGYEKIARARSGVMQVADADADLRVGIAWPT